MGMETELSMLRYLSLHNADGSDFDPYTYPQFHNWLQGANAKDMTYMLSAQMAATFLNLDAGFVNSYSIVYTPGCGLMGNSNFSYLMNLAWNSNYYLQVYTTSPGDDPNRSYLVCLKNSLDNANNNTTSVQSAPCSAPAITSAINSGNRTDTCLNDIEAIVWPNPSHAYFTLRPAKTLGLEAVQIRVFDITGKQVYTAKGNSNEDYRFGEKLFPGMYMVQIIQGTATKTFKLIKQYN
jgi:hypothetical protein